MILYKGDSPSKKFARLAFWQLAQEELGQSFYSKEHVVLASEEAGDVSTLLGFGVQSDKIIGIDIDPIAIELASEKFPFVDFRSERIEHFLMERKEPLGSVYLDFCSSLNQRVVHSVRLAAETVQRGIVGVSFMIGREHTFREEILRKRAHVKELLGADLANMSSAVARAVVVQSHVNNIKLLWVGRYSSTTAKRQGANMGIALFRVGGRPVPMFGTEFIQYTETDVRNALFKQTRWSAPNVAMRLKLNISKGSYAAFKANHTRGAYKR